MANKWMMMMMTSRKHFGNFERRVCEHLVRRPPFQRRHTGQ